MKLERDIKSIFKSFKAKLDKRIEGNNNNNDDEDEDEYKGRRKRELTLNERNIQESKGYYYEHWDTALFDAVEYETIKEGYYSGFFITQNKFIFINHTTYKENYGGDYIDDTRELYGIKLVATINSQDKCIFLYV